MGSSSLLDHYQVERFDMTFSDDIDMTLTFELNDWIIN